MGSLAGNETSTSIVAMGAATAIGRTALASMAAARCGISGFVEHPYFVDRMGEPMVTAIARYLPMDISWAERCLALAVPAAREALAPLSTCIKPPSSLPLFLGIPSPRPGSADSPIPGLIHGFTVRCDLPPLSRIETFATGNSAGLMALEEGCKFIDGGGAEFCLVGACDSYLEADTLEWLDERGRLKSSMNPWGFVPGEGAAFCLLASHRAMGQAQLKSLGRVLVATTTREESGMKTETICLGAGLTKAIRLALQQLPTDRKVDQVLCDLNGEYYRTDEYGFSIARLSAHFRDATDFWAPADCWGDLGAASGPMLVCKAVASGARGYAKGPLNLIWTSSETGERTATLLEVPVQAIRH